MSVPLPTSPDDPASVDNFHYLTTAGQATGPFGVEWSLSAPAITARRTIDLHFGQLEVVELNFTFIFVQGAGGHPGDQYWVTGICGLVDCGHPPLPFSLDFLTCVE